MPKSFKKRDYRKSKKKNLKGGKSKKKSRKGGKSKKKSRKGGKSKNKTGGMNADAPSFVPGSFQFNPTVSSFVPRMERQSSLPLKTKAAKRIQSATRRRQSTRNKSAKNIQRAFRTNRLNKQKTKSAKRIQSAWKAKKVGDKTRADYPGVSMPREVYPWQTQKKIFFESALGDDILDRQESLEDLSRETKKIRDKTYQKINQYEDDHRYKQSLKIPGLLKNVHQRDLGQGWDVKFKNPSYTLEPALTRDIEDLTPEQLKEKTRIMGLVDWLDTQEPIIKTAVDNLVNITNLLNKKDRELDELNNLDLFNCKKIRALAEADIKYYNDPDTNKYIQDCRLNQTQMFINTFYKLDLELIIPQRQNRWLSVDRVPSIEDKINSFPNDKFTKGAKTALIDTLIDHNLFKYVTEDTRRYRRFMDPRSKSATIHNNRFDLFVFYLRTYNKDETQHHVTTGEYINANNFPGNTTITIRHESPDDTEKASTGRELLESILNLFELTILERNIKDKSPEKIERMKRYFIYTLIGFDDIENYIKKLADLIYSLFTTLELDIRRFDPNAKRIQLDSLINFNNIDKAGDFDEIEETSPEIYKQLSENAFTEANCCGFGTDRYSTLDEAIVNMGEEYKNIQSFHQIGQKKLNNMINLHNDIKNYILGEDEDISDYYYELDDRGIHEIRDNKKLDGIINDLPFGRRLLQNVDPVIATKIRNNQFSYNMFSEY